MNSINRRLVRAACRLHAAYSAVQRDRFAIDLPEQAWRDLEESHRLWTAIDGRWPLAAARKREAFVYDLERLKNRLQSQIVSLGIVRPRVPTLGLLYEELAAVEAEFPGVELVKGELVITTEPVTLDDIPLGPFQIRLHLDRLENETPYSVTALEPNPAGSCSDTVHPHVNADRLCPGEGRAAITAALVEGRLLDFATIVDRILHTYAADSAYVALDDWHGVSCHDCNSTVNEEDACTCPHCEERICEDCRISCGGCGDGYCTTCIDRCSRCEEYSCSDCLTPCDRCRRHVCAACREDKFCETCREELEPENDAEKAEESPAETVDEATKPAV